MSEFSLYDQNPPRTAFMFNYNSSSSNSACQIAIPFDTYYHDDSNNLVPDAINIYTAYTTQTGTTVAAAGYYAIYTTGGSASGSYIRVGNNGLIIEVDDC